VGGNLLAFAGGNGWKQRSPFLTAGHIGSSGKKRKSREGGSEGQQEQTGEHG